VNYQCNMQSPGELASTIERVSEDVIVVIRGGGDQTQFEVFDDMEVVSALAKKDSYRIVGLGHTANTTALDLVADYSANTPTQAGVHLGDCYRRYAYPNDALSSENRILQQQLANSQKEVAELLSVRNKEESKLSKALGLIYAFAIGALIAGVSIAWKLKK
jgi:exonuclease VII large subunit